MARAPTAAVVIIGNEVLTGKVQDENGPFLIRALRTRGIRLKEMRTIDDDVDTIVDSVQTLAPAVEYLFTTGGIGPTHDDLTLSAMARAFQCPMIRHAELVRRIHERYGAAPGEAKLRLAEVPERASVDLDSAGLVPVIQLDNVFVLPGVPSLMRMCFARLSPRLCGTAFYTGHLLLDTSETAIADHLRSVQEQHPDVVVGSYPRIDRTGWLVKVTVDGTELDVVRTVLDRIHAGVDVATVLETQQP